MAVSWQSGGDVLTMLKQWRQLNMGINDSGRRVQLFGTLRNLVNIPQPVFEPAMQFDPGFTFSRIL